MAKIDFNLAITNGDSNLDYPQFAPGDILKVSLTLFPNEEIDCKHLYARLVWHTHGRGTRFIQNVSELDLFQGTMQSGIPQSYQFEFSLPSEPWSYEGHYVSIVWKVQVQVDISWSADPKAEQAFVLIPAAR